MNTTILRRYRLGKVSCNAIQSIIKDKFNKDISIVRNDKIVSGNTSDILIRWGCTNSFNSTYVINTPEMIHAVNNKAESRKLMQENNISVPFSMFSIPEVLDFLSTHGGTTVIGRKSFHHQGRELKEIKTKDDLLNDVSEYWSEFVDKEKEYRVFTFFGRVIAVAEKVPTNKDKVAWNRFGEGSSFNNVNWNNWPLDVCNEAIKASELFGIDFSGVDVMVKDTTPYILEINSAHSLSSEYRQTCFSKALNWLIDSIEANNIKPNHLELDTNKKNYKRYIHPYFIG